MPSLGVCWYCLQPMRYYCRGMWTDLLISEVCHLWSCEDGSFLFKTHQLSCIYVHVESNDLQLFSLGYAAAIRFGKMYLRETLDHLRSLRLSLFCQDIAYFLSFRWNAWDYIYIYISEIKSPENRKLYVSKHIYECIKGELIIMLHYQTDDYSLLSKKNLNQH